jgi:flagellar basal-body rod protein FlgF
MDFVNWHGFRCVSCGSRLGRAGGSQDPQPAWEGFARIIQGRTTMQNALLIGLSRQTMLERQLDVVANNIANVNTTGFKADNSLFEEYLSSSAHEDNFVGSDRRISYVQDRGTFKDFTQGNAEETKNPLDIAIEGSAFLVVQTQAGDRYTRDGGLQLNGQGQLVTSAGNPVLGTGGPIVFQPTDHDISITPDGTITVVEGTNRTDSIRGKLQLVNFPDAQKLLKEGFNLYAAGEGGGPQPDAKSVVRQGYLEKSNVNAVAEMSRMMEVSRAYTSISSLLQQESDLHKSAIQALADVPT